MHVFALSHDKKLLDSQSRPFKRQVMYAERLEKLSIFIPTSAREQAIETKNLVVIAVSARLLPVRAGKLFVTLYLALKESARTEPTLLTVQSPFEFGLIGLIVAGLCRVPLEVQVHGDFYSSPYWRHEVWGNYIRFVIGLFVLRRATGVRVVSQRIKSSLIKKGISEAQITVLPIEISLTPFVTAAPQPFWNQVVGTTIISVGRFSVEKNFPLLILSFKKVHDIFPDTQLVLVGEGKEELKLRQLVSSLWSLQPPVHFYPWQPNVASVMKAADIYALSSDYEGYALVLGEAMASGLAVVTTDVGCVGELCLPDTHALVVPPRAEEAYTAALMCLVKDKKLRAEMVIASQAVVVTLPTDSTAYATAVVSTWYKLVTK